MHLEKYEMTRDGILNGDTAEYEAVDNPKKVKEPMYLAAVVDQVTENTFADLREAYAEIDVLTSTIANLESQLQNVNLQYSEVNDMAEVKASDIERLKATETMVAEMETVFTTLKSKRVEDAAQIDELNAKLAAAEENAVGQQELSTLRQRVSELESIDKAREGDYQALANDVNSVLDSLEEQFAHLTVE